MVKPIITVIEGTTFNFALKGDKEINKVTPSCGCSTSSIKNNIAVVSVELAKVKDSVSDLAYKAGKDYYSKNVSFKLHYIDNTEESITMILNVIENANQ